MSKGSTRALSALTLALACAGCATYVDPADGKAVAAGIEVYEDALAGTTTFIGPRFEGGGLTAWLQAARDKQGVVFELRAVDLPRRGWQQYESATDPAGEPLPFSVLAPQAVGCSVFGCTRRSVLVAEIPLETVGPRGYTVRFHARTGDPRTVPVPWPYAHALLERVGPVWHVE